MAIWIRSLAYILWHNFSRRFQYLFLLLHYEFFLVCHHQLLCTAVEIMGSPQGPAQRCYSMNINLALPPCSRNNFCFLKFHLKFAMIFLLSLPSTAWITAAFVDVLHSSKVFQIHKDRAEVIWTLRWSCYTTWTGHRRYWTKIYWETEKKLLPT